MRIRHLLLLAAGLALADASVVTLALPPVIDELDASVEGAAAVLSRDRRGLTIVAATGAAALALGAGARLALPALDRAACRHGSSREKLALALVDDGARADYEREFGVDPRDIGGLLGAVLGP